MRIIVLGTGLVGGAMVKDLAADKDFEIIAVDADKTNLDKLKNLAKVKRIKADLSDTSTLSKLVLDSDLVIGALPGFMGFSALKTIIECGKDVVDISFFPEDALKLNQLAKEKQVTAVVDCGVAPGCSNLILGYMSGILDQTESFACYVGGLPRVRTWPYEYKAPFSPSDVLEEYTRPSRFVENGKVVTKPALSEMELLDFPEVGTLEAFNTDGLRSLLFTMEVPFMKEKTMRYPGHAEKMRMLWETGFFDQEQVQVSGVKVRPLDLTSKLLFSKWKLNEGEEDFTVMRIVVEGKKEGKRKQYQFDLLDRYDQKTKTTSMARTTGYTCTTVARLLARKKICHIGICPPEFLGQNHEYYHLIMDGLKEKNIHFKEKVKELV
jgi:lysine 6-dehydrogenase